MLECQTKQPNILSEVNQELLFDEIYSRRSQLFLCSWPDLTEEIFGMPKTKKSDLLISRWNENKGPRIIPCMWASSVRGRLMLMSHFAAVHGQWWWWGVRVAAIWCKVASRAPLRSPGSSRSATSHIVEMRKYTFYGWLFSYWLRGSPGWLAGAWYAVKSGGAEENKHSGGSEPFSFKRHQMVFFFFFFYAVLTFLTAVTALLQFSTAGS